MSFPCYAQIPKLFRILCLSFVCRAVYSKADMYLLDDPLSAVDATVARHLVDNCLQGLLKDKCVLIITHQLNFFSPDTLVLFLEDGRIAKTGRMQELQSTLVMSPQEDTTLDALVVTDDKTEWVDRSGHVPERYAHLRLTWNMG